MSFGGFGVPAAGAGGFGFGQTAGGIPNPFGFGQTQAAAGGIASPFGAPAATASPFDAPAAGASPKGYKRRPLLEALVVHGGVPRPSDDDAVESVFNFASGEGGQEDETFSEWCVPKTEDQEENLYKGHRAVLEAIIRRDGLVKDFHEISNSAAWVIRTIQGKLIPALEDEETLYLLLPTSAKHAEQGFRMPHPDARHPNSTKYMAGDVWFENCNDGGVYILGFDEDVLIMYVDGPGDMVSGRFKCSRQRWLEMWTAAFKTEHVEYPGLAWWRVVGQISRVRSEIAIAQTRTAGAFEWKDRSLAILSAWILENWLPQSMREQAQKHMGAERKRFEPGAAISSV